MKYDLEQHDQHVPSVKFRSFAGKSLEDEPELLNYLVGLLVQLDKDEQTYDKPYGLRMKNPNADLKTFFRNKLLNAQSINIVIVDSVCCGCLLATNVEYVNCYSINSLCIDKNYRHKGYGKMLMEYVINRRKGQTPILRVSLGNSAGLALYKSLGFKPMSQLMIKM